MISVSHIKQKAVYILITCIFIKISLTKISTQKIQTKTCSKVHARLKQSLRMQTCSVLFLIVMIVFITAYNIQIYTPFINFLNKNQHTKEANIHFQSESEINLQCKLMMHASVSLNICFIEHQFHKILVRVMRTDACGQQNRVTEQQQHQ